MASLRAGSARDLVYRAMAALKPEASTGEVVRAIGGKVERNNIDVAIAKGVREGDIKRTGERGGYRYTLRAGVVECAASSAAAVPPPWRGERGSCSRRRRSIARSRHEVRRAA